MRKYYPLASVLLASLLALLPACKLSAASTVQASETRSPVQISALETELMSGAFSEKSLNDLQSILEQEPNNAKALLILAGVYVQRGLLSEAEETYLQAARCSPDNPEALIQLAKLYVMEGKDAQCMQTLKEANSRFPTSAAVLMMEGFALYSQKKYAEAEKTYALASKVNPGVLGLGSAIAQIKLQQRKYGEALLLCEADLKQDKNYLPGNLNKAYALAGLGQFQQATEPLKVVFAKEPFRPEIAATLAQCLLLSNDFDAALEPALVDLALCVKTPKQPAAKLLASRLLKAVPEEQAKAAIEKVSSRLDKIDREGLAANFHFAMGDVFDTNKRPAQAMKQYHAGLDINPLFGRGWLRLAEDTESYCHRYQEALLLYARAYKHDPSCTECTVRSERLKLLLKARENDLAWLLKDWLWGRN